MVKLYTREQHERAETADPIWNAARRQLLADSRIHNYLRMLWGKKILEWPLSPLATLIELNNKYSVDGRDPNSYSAAADLRHDPLHVFALDEDQAGTTSLGGRRRLH